MPDWKAALTEGLRHAAHGVETEIDRAKWRVKRRMNRVRPLQIVPYRGYGTATHFFLMGRVLEEQPMGLPRAEETWADNLRASLLRFESDEAPGVAVGLRVGRTWKETRTDQEGYFRFAVEQEPPFARDRLWHDVTLELTEPDRLPVGQDRVTALGQVLVPQCDSTLGVVSDIDDTVLRTHVTDLCRMLRVTLLDSARTRLPFPGAAAFYRALHEGPKGSGRNPVFYVSRSPWNLYDLLVSFLELHDIPAGPLLLRDFGLEKAHWLAEGDKTHKVHEIRRILRTYPHLPFVLVGDATERDPQVYRQIVREFPGRIDAIYIRESGRTASDEQARSIAAELRGDGVEMLVVPDSEAAAIHAADHGLIDPAALDEIRRDRQADTSSPHREPQTALE